MRHSFTKQIGTMTTEGDRLSVYAPLDTTPPRTRVTKNDALELKQLTKMLRENHQAMQHIVDIESMVTHVEFKQYIIESRNNILKKYRPTIPMDTVSIANILLERNLKKLHKPANKEEKQQVATPEMERKVAIAKDDNVIAATKTNTALKQTHHHYAGFYAKEVLPPVEKTIKCITKEGQENLAHVDFNNKAVNYGYSGNDTIITVQPVATVNKDICPDLPLGTIVKNYESNVTSGMITGKITTGNYDQYPVQNGFRETNIHINTRAVHKYKTKPIVYADKQFSNKAELNEYLATLNTKPNIGAIIYTDSENKHTQLILHSQGHTVANVQLRHRLCDKYQTNPPLYTPYKNDTCHASGF